MQRGNHPLELLYCQSCDNICNRYPSSKRCLHCSRNKITFRCSESCNTSRTVCEYCDVQFSQPVNKKSKSENAKNGDTGIFSYIIYGVGGLLILLFVLIYFKSSTNDQLDSKNLLKKLREEFPSQKNETWYHVLSVLDKTIPSVKTITFLHGEDKRTPDCLTNKIVLLSSGDENINSDEITFSAVGYEGKDFGFALEHYRTIVEKFRVFITDLTIVPGNIAGIFHSLCDEVSSDIKPSLFIFTLKYDKSTDKLKPMKRAEAILKKVWSDLPDNEIFPLLSRVIKNVVEILPEKLVNC